MSRLPLALITPTPTPTPTPQAELSVSDTLLQFSAAEGDPNPTPQSLSITNIGAADLNWTATATSNGNWLSVSGGSPSLKPQQTTELMVSVNISGLSASNTLYEGVITISAPNAKGSPKNVRVTLLLINAPDKLEFVIDSIRVNSMNPEDDFNSFDFVIFDSDVRYQLV